MPSTLRTFMAAAAAAPLVQAWQRSPNDRIRLGQIGCGGRSRDHLSELVKSGENAALVAVCEHLGRQSRTARGRYREGIRRQNQADYTLSGAAGDAGH